MRIKRGGLALDGDADGVIVATPETAVRFDADELRWLLTAGLPLIAATVPSEAPATIAETPSEDGQIPGQLRIE